MFGSVTVGVVYCLFICCFSVSIRVFAIYGHTM